MSLLLDSGANDAGAGITFPVGLTSNLFTSNPISLDGATRIKFELFWSAIYVTDLTVTLYDNAVLLNQLQRLITNSSSQLLNSGYGVAFATPSAGVHTYAFKAVAAVRAGFTGLRFWYRITRVPDGTDIAYVERTTDFVGVNPVFTTAPLSYDGARRARIEVFSPRMAIGSASPAEVTLLDNAVTLGGLVEEQASTGISISWPLYASRFLTPSAGTHTFSVEATNATIYADSAIYLPAFLRVTDA